MIALLTGTIVSKAPNTCVIDVNGVGYSVLISLTTFATLPDAGNPSSLLVHTYVREDAILLYGFATLEEKALFQKLISISGVGPKTALSILSGLPVTHLIEAISNEDRARLSTIPGVGKKTAERIIIELKDKIAKEFQFSETAETTPKGRISEDVISALTNLGYQRAAAENTLRKIKLAENTSIEDALRCALKELCKM